MFVIQFLVGLSFKLRCNETLKWQIFFFFFFWHRKTFFRYPVLFCRSFFSDGLLKIRKNSFVNTFPIMFGSCSHLYRFGLSSFHHFSSIFAHFFRKLSSSSTYSRLLSTKIFPRIYLTKSNTVSKRKRKRTKKLFPFRFVCELKRSRRSTPTTVRTSLTNAKRHLCQINNSQLQTSFHFFFVSFVVFFNFILLFWFVRMIRGSMVENTLFLIRMIWFSAHTSEIEFLC